MIDQAKPKRGRPKGSKTRRRKLKTIGQLHPDCIYNADGLLRFAGIGRNTLAEIRASGIKPRQIGSRRFYRGRDIIEWILSREQPAEGKEARC